MSYDDWSNYNEDENGEFYTCDDISMDEVYRLMELIEESDEFKIKLKKEIENLKSLTALKSITQDENSSFIKVDISVYQECSTGLDNVILSFDIEGDRKANITYINHKIILRHYLQK